MLGNNIKTLRIQKGYSQETLAQQLHVVRQTVSKWEKEISVPDAEMLVKIAELLDVPVSDLLGSKIPKQEQETDEQAIARQLAILNEHLASTSTRRRKIAKRVLLGIGIGILSVVAFVTVLVSLLMVPANASTEEQEQISISDDIDE